MKGRIMMMREQLDWEFEWAPQNYEIWDGAIDDHDGLEAIEDDVEKAF